jgi:hypothetical protein
MTLTGVRSVRKGRLHTHIGFWPEPYIYTVYGRMFGGFHAKSTMYTLYIYTVYIIYIYIYIYIYCTSQPYTLHTHPPFLCRWLRRVRQAQKKLNTSSLCRHYKTCVVRRALGKRSFKKHSFHRALGKKNYKSFPSVVRLVRGITKAFLPLCAW